MVAVVAILLLLWLLGVISNNTFGGLIHLLLVIGLVVLLLSLAGGGTRRGWRLSANRNLGMVLAGIWFGLTGLLQLTGFTFQGEGILLAVVALLAGALLVIGR